MPHPGPVGGIQLGDQLGDRLPAAGELQGDRPPLGPGVPVLGEWNLDVGRTVRAVRQRETTLSLDFEDGGTLEIVTAEPTSSVMVRDKEQRLEYAD